MKSYIKKAKNDNHPTDFSSRGKIINSTHSLLEAAPLSSTKKFMVRRYDDFLWTGDKEHSKLMCIILLTKLWLTTAEN
jgi:hypothetical protein